MVKKSNKAGLGRGLDALFGDLSLDGELEQVEISKVSDGPIEVNGEQVYQVPLEEIRPNPYQPRRVFEPEALQELADSIKISGVIQPVILRKSTIKGYEVIAGERRLRASKLADKETIPAIIREFTEQEMIEIAILENLQREDLNPIEEAQAYETYMKELELTQVEAAERLGKSRSYLANYLRLLKLPDHVQDLVQGKKLSMGHARTLLGLEQKEQITKFAQKTVKEGWSVRELERQVQEANQALIKPKVHPVKEQKPTIIKESEDRLMDKFGTSVQIKNKGEKGKIEIEYLSQDDLTRILDILEIQIDD